MSEINRRSLIAFTVAAVAISASGNAAVAKRPVVLFICEFGTAKSAIARELFRRRARERGIAVTAFSRGSKKIEDHVSPPLKAALAAEEIETRLDGFAVLTPRDLRAADVIVAFAPISQSVHGRELLDWSAVPSVNDAWPTARTDLDRRIEALLDRIAAGQAKRR